MRGKLVFYSFLLYLAFFFAVYSTYDENSWEFENVGIYLPIFPLVTHSYELQLPL